MKLHHIAIQVFDLERANTFYQRLFGLKEIRRQEHSIWLDLDGSILMLERCAQSNPKTTWRSEQPGIFVLALTIKPEERQPFREELVALGIEISHETNFTTYFFDPDGNRLAVSHYPTA